MAPVLKTCTVAPVVGATSVAALAISRAVVELDSCIGFFSCGGERASSPTTKKADVAEHPKVFRYVGLLVNWPPGTAGLLSV